MRIGTPFLFLLAAIGAIAASVEESLPRECLGAKPTQQMINAALTRMEIRRLQDSIGDLMPRMALIEVDVYVHVITDEYDSFIKQWQVEEQIAVLNNAYEPHGITFRLVGKVNYQVRPDWAFLQRRGEMAKELRKGGYEALNIYMVESLRGGPLGITTLPEERLRGYNEKTGKHVPPFYLDGAIVRADTVPGGKNKYYNRGMTLVHEVGHWFNLYHPWDFGCLKNHGDHILDTPVADHPVLHCEPKSDTCPNHPGKDPIHNYMSYTPDPCLTEFTRGQMYEMHDAWYKYRSPEERYAHS